MTSDTVKTFVTRYLSGLRERTREERGGMKWGIDWVIYNLGLSLYGKPVRLPFMRQEDGSPKSKSEAEFGIDVAFLSSDRTQLAIFVLKDEPLTNRTWVANGFHEDLSKAISPDLSAEGLEAVTSVEVILAYNRDEESNGVTLYQRFVGNAPRRLADRANLAFTRWNLSELVDLTLRHILTPALLPQQFFGQLGYLCAQFADFRHGTDEWEQQFVPGWKRFVDDALRQGSDVRGLLLVPVALIILRQHGQENRSLETGWIDLIEWTAIALWRRFMESDDHAVKIAVARFWDDFYLAELDRFYRAHIDALATENAIDQLARASFVGAAASGVVAYWHLARIGLLSIGRAQSLPIETADEQRKQREALQEVANWMIRLINANQSTLRPLLDIHHIELFLLALTLHNSGRLDQFGTIMPALVQRLYLRRIGFSEIPFLDGRNSLESVFEQVATNGEEKLITGESSFLVLMLLELSCLLSAEIRSDLLEQIHRRLVMGAMDKGQQPELKPLHLMSWIPPKDWDAKVFRGYVEDGETVSRGPFSNEITAPASELFAEMTRFVDQMRSASTDAADYKAPLGALVLASLRHQSPLPPELWRNAAFPKVKEEAIDAS